MDRVKIVFVMITIVALPWVDGFVTCKPEKSDDSDSYVNPFLQPLRDDETIIIKNPKNLERWEREYDEYWRKLEHETVKANSVKTVETDHIPKSNYDLFNQLSYQNMFYLLAYVFVQCVFFFVLYLYIIFKLLLC